jgi:hypothetical protein
MASSEKKSNNPNRSSKKHKTRNATEVVAKTKHLDSADRWSAVIRDLHRQLEFKFEWFDFKPGQSKSCKRASKP